MRVRVYDNLDSLPPAFLALLEEAGCRSFYLSRPWFANLAETATERGSALRIHAIDNDGEALGLVVLRGEPDGDRAGRRIVSHTNYFSMLFAPILAQKAGDGSAVFDALARSLAKEKPRLDLVRIGTMDPATPAFGTLATGFRSNGFIVQTFFHFGNWYEKTDGLSFDDFMARRPSALRNTIRRKGKKLASKHSVAYSLFTREPDLDRGIAAYQAVYAKSWKEPEHFDRFTEGLIRIAAEEGALRLGILTVDDEPAAAQIWLVAAGQATIYKLAYDEHFKSLSVGSILTHRIAEHVIANDRVREIDFGSGDDPYKQQWLSQRRERWGFVAFNPRSPRGGLLALRHVGGRAVKRALGRLRPT